MLPSIGLVPGARLAPLASHALSPRQQQAVRLLQMSSPDYGQLLRQAACENPFLEWAEHGLPAVEDTPVAAGAAPAAADDPGWEPDEAAMPAPVAQGPQDNLPQTATLSEHLRGQLGLMRLPAREEVLVLALAASLDDDGYLRLAPEELNPALPELWPPPASQEWALALRRVQGLQPAGVGARDLAECLVLQLMAQDPGPQQALALRIVREHLPAVAAHDLSGIARQLGESLAAVQAACGRIRRLDPRPGWRIGPTDSGVITPDVVVRRRRGQWVAHLNPAALPRVRLQQAYAGWYVGHRAQAGPTLGRQLQEARWMLRNAEQRFSTILAVARAILQRQHRFLALGPMALRPMGLREIARAVGVHESTVSRVTQHKYMATPCGLFELRFFFSRGLATASGGACSPAAVRGLIRELVAAESPAAPLSDMALAQTLASQGLRVARRTVTKYRQQLRIEPAPRRGGGSGHSLDSVRSSPPCPRRPSPPPCPPKNSGSKPNWSAP